MTLAVGLDLGGTKIAGGLVSPSGSVSATASVPTPADDGPAAIITAAAQLVAAIAGHAREPVAGIGIGAAGVIDPVTGRVIAATSSLRNWAGTALGSDLQAATGLPVACDNDVRVHALGEAWLGAGEGAESMLLIAAGTGIGGAYVTGDGPTIGAHAAAGHFGHIPSPEAAGLPCTCGRTGHLEVIASGPAILQAYERAATAPTAPGAPTDGRFTYPSTTQDVVRLAAEGDATAAEAVAAGAGALGRAVAGLVNSLDPSLVVVTGGMADAGPTWWNPLHAAFDDELMDIVRDCPLRPATLGSNAALIGAAKLVFDERARS
ncbi:ROK family protein [Spelaeicoccus albus]|uniref:Glucokinase n=1 Tax=Spelaeicoccus albus TaxID=1280376 RepID=A0A7Z0D293_9MICO|nr:ROK family protein [Spelaeicoccus albus]NYI67508.1 glucokinase [Spelaeicoccus albus]